MKYLSICISSEIHPDCHALLYTQTVQHIEDLPHQEVQSNVQEVSPVLDPEPVDRSTEPLSVPDESIADTQTLATNASGSGDEVVLTQPNKDDQNEASVDKMSENESGTDEEASEEATPSIDNGKDVDELADESREQGESFAQDTDVQDEKSNASDSDHQSVSDPDDMPQPMEEASETQQEGTTSSNPSETASEGKTDEQVLSER